MTFRRNVFVSLAKNLQVELFIVSQYRKIIFLKGVGHEFLWKSFCLTVPELFVVEPFCVSEKI